MARVSDDLVVQLVGDDLVLVDGQMTEFRIRYPDVNRFLLVCEYLRRHASAYDPDQVAAETARLRAAEALVDQQLRGGRR